MRRLLTAVATVAALAAAPAVAMADAPECQAIALRSVQAVGPGRPGPNLDKGSVVDIARYRAGEGPRSLCSDVGACYPASAMRLLNCEVALGSGYPGGDGETYYDLYLVPGGTVPEQAPAAPPPPKTMAQYIKRFEASHANMPDQLTCSEIADYTAQVFFKIQNGIYTPDRMATDVRTMEFQGYMSPDEANTLLLYIAAAAEGNQSTPLAMAQAEYQGCKESGGGLKITPQDRARLRQKLGQ